MHGIEDSPTRLDALDLVPDVAVDVVIPVYNEEAGLARSITTLHRYLSSTFPVSWTITIADNASTDATLAIAHRLAAELGGVRVLHLDRKGRGRALRAAWGSSGAAVVAYMDVDLSTGLDALLPLVAPLLSGHSDLAIGTRLAPGSQIVRGPRREVISRIYNRIVRASLRTTFTDAQCGFKAVRADVVGELLPLVEDESWYFDTELLAVAEHNGLRIHEVPVDWVDDPDSRVDIVSTARDDLRGVARTMRRLAAGRVSLPGDASTRFASPNVVDQLIRFASTATVSVVVASVLFLLMAPTIGTVAANVVAFTVCAALNARPNRCWPMTSRGRSARARRFVGAIALGSIPLVVSTVLLVLLDLDGVTSLGVALAAVLSVNVTATVLRFVLLRQRSRVDVREPDAVAAVRPFTGLRRTRPASADT